MPSGIVLLDKPPGLSSNGALQRVRALFSRAKAGHVGSLDPLATGMLPICLGEATKLAGAILEGRKRYRFSVALGVRTATGDAEGAPTAQAPVPPLERSAVALRIAAFVGRQQQVPPMYSALKHAGQPLYRLARAGLSIERAARDIHISELTLLELDPASLTLEALCSKGTYIRVLAEDLAAALGTLGHVTALRRVYVEPFQNEPMHALEALAALCAAGAAPLLAPDWPLQHLPAVRLAPREAARLLQGQSVAAEPACAGAARVRLYDDAGTFLGLGESDAQGVVQPRRLLNRAE
jgi:tRNA pseudouridine55 synthase